MASENKDLLKVLKAAIVNDAPGLAPLLDGPNAAVAISALGKALLGDAEASLAEVTAEAQKGDKLKIVAAEQEVQLRLRQNDAGSLDALAATLEEDKAHLADTQSAREMQIKTHDSTNRWLAFTVSAAFFLIIASLIWWPPKDTGFKDILYTLLGVVATGWANIIGFYFGSSAGSAQKSQTIDAALARSSSNNPPSGA